MPINNVLVEPQLEQDLNQQWQMLLEKSGIQPHFSAGIWEDLVTRHCEPWRHYHGLHHVGEVLHHLDSFALPVTQFTTLAFGAWFHDAIYKPWRRNNEQQSAVLAVKTLLAMGVEETAANKVGDAVMATYHGGDTETPEVFWPLVDADLAILGSSWPRYQTYTQQIRKEYSIYPTMMYRMGRIRILKAMLDKPRLYGTELFFGRFEQPARENLSRELALLG